VADFFVTEFPRGTTPFIERPKTGGNETQRFEKEFVMRKQILSRFTPAFPSLVLGLMLVGLMALPALAGPRGGGGFRFLRHLDLAEAQQAQVRDVMATHRPEMQSRMTELQDAREALREAIRGESFDEGAVRAAHGKVAAQAEEMAVLRARAFAEIRPILTPEQQARLETLPGRGMGMGKGRGMGKGHGMGKGR
jgi:Spy/CpxP family protein refolding chaperone